MQITIIIVIVVLVVIVPLAIYLIYRKIKPNKLKLTSKGEEIDKEGHDRLAIVWQGKVVLVSAPFFLENNSLANSK